MPYVHVADHAANPVELYYEDTDADTRAHPGTDACPVVLIHGWLQTAQIWQSQRRALESRGHRVVTYDRRGFGRSSKPDTAYDFDVFAADLHALLAHLDLHDVALVGFSNGGGDAARYLGTYGSRRISRVAFVSATPPCIHLRPDNPEGRLTDDVIAWLQEALHSDRSAFTEHMVTDMFTPAGGSHELAGPAVHREAVAQAEVASVRAAADSVMAWRTDFRADLARIRIPALVLHGEHDHVLPFEATGRRTHQQIRGASLVLVGGGPHALFATHAEEVNRALSAFLHE